MSRPTFLSRLFGLKSRNRNDDSATDTTSSKEPPMNILRIDASGRHAGSHSRDLIDQLIEKLTVDGREARVVERDLIAAPPPPVDDAWIGAAFTPDDQRTPQQRAVLRTSEALIEELKAADLVVIGCPIYNWGVPAALKAWIDQVCRARVTFAYGADGPVGLLENKKTYLVVTSGGTEVGSEADYATSYLRFVLGVIGLKDVELIAADRLMVDPDASLERARTVIGEVHPSGAGAAYAPA